MSDTTTEAAETQTDGGEQQEQQTFTQADVDKIVKSRAERIAKQLYPDYEDLKAKAEGAKSVEQKLADLEQKHADAEARALRSDIAAKHGITPEDRDLFLTGSDEATLTAQATRLAERIAESKSKGNVARKEGGTTTTGTKDQEGRTFARSLFGGGD